MVSQDGYSDAFQYDQATKKGKNRFKSIIIEYIERGNILSCANYQRGCIRKIDSNLRCPTVMKSLKNNLYANGWNRKVRIVS